MHRIDNSAKDGVIVRRERLKAGRSISVPAGAVVWLPDGYRACTLIVATPAGEQCKHEREPLLAKQHKSRS